MPNRLPSTLFRGREKLGIAKDLFEHGRRIAGRGLLHVSTLVARDLDQQSVRNYRAGCEFGDVFRVRPLVAVLDQKPRGARLTLPAPCPHEYPRATELLPFERELQIASFERRV